MRLPHYVPALLRIRTFYLAGPDATSYYGPSKIIMSPCEVQTVNVDIKNINAWIRKLENWSFRFFPIISAASHKYLRVSGQTAKTSLWINVLQVQFAQVFKITNNLNDWPSLT
jgi:hypothetical protein